MLALTTNNSIYRFVTRWLFSTNHWSTNFFFLKIFNKLTLIALPLVIFILTLALPFHPAGDPVLFFNIYEIGLISCITFIVSFLIDVYIILFGNSLVTSKFGIFCYRCALYSSVGLGCGYFAEKQFIHNSFDKLGFQWQPTFLTNVPRIMIKPIVLDYYQYWQQHLIQKYLPDISQEQYVSKHNNIVSQINSSKANQILKNNWNTLSENATSQELKKIRLGQGYLSSNITRK